MSLVTVAVEGDVDASVVRRLLADVGAGEGPVHVARGKPKLLNRFGGYNNAATRSPWLVLVDLDRDADCVPPFRQQWMPAPAEHMCFRVAVRMVESWLLADRERFARFLGVSAATLPREPDEVDDPKGVVVELARNSRRRDVREELVPRAGSGRRVGALYPSRLIEFVSGSWRPEEARARSDSLDRCLMRLGELGSSLVREEA